MLAQFLKPFVWYNQKYFVLVLTPPPHSYPYSNHLTNFGFLVEKAENSLLKILKNHSMIIVYSIYIVLGYVST